MDKNSKNLSIGIRWVHESKNEENQWTCMGLIYSMNPSREVHGNQATNHEMNEPDATINRKSINKHEMNQCSESMNPKTNEKLWKSMTSVFR